MIGLSIFDVDRTLTKRPTYTAFLLAAAWSRAPWRLALAPALAFPALAYATRWLERRRMKEAMHRVALGSALPRAEALALADAFAARLHDRGLYAEGRALIESEKADGRVVLLATAAPALYIEPLAARLGADGVIASGATWRDEALLPAITGDNCHGPAKLAMIRAHLDRAGIDRAAAHVRFYSDHASDLPCFQWADDPIAVNPSPKLRAIALARGWTVLDWRLPAS